MTESNHFRIEAPLVIAGFVCGLTGCSLGAPLAMAGFVCGLSSCAFGLGLMPTLAIPALVLGIVGAAFGFMGRRRSILEGTESPLALPALILGCVAVCLATIGLVIVASRT